jgi:cyclopropane-fatty-acyl-phospholipid synthase
MSEPMTGSAASTPLALRLLERDLVPDWLIRRGIRALLRQRLAGEDLGDPERQQRHLMRFIADLKAGPIAMHMRAANEQHYELPSEFFVEVLGRHLKYSCCYFERVAGGGAAAEPLAQAEERMLALTAERARIADGDQILELGCGWGSLTLWMAGRFPRARITAVSNSRSQREFIEQRAAERGLTNVTVLTRDMNALEFPAGTAFDRVVSVEMFEHMRNYEELLRRIAGWMRPRATLFVHIFAHQRFAYPFEIRDASDWMARYFFTGGIMPSDGLLHYFQSHLRIIDRWQVSGWHYQQTAEAWLSNMDGGRTRIMPVLAATYGPDAARRWWVYWRVFFMACAELFGYRKGREWLVSHYLFERPD